ncbi:MAG: zf-HC2 domain-containing protein, partial [Chloroflexi bacterium]
MNNTNPLPLPDDTMPPLPEAGEYGPQVCSTVCLYLAILDDLSPRQVQLLREHVDNCADCATVHRFMQRTTRVFASLPESAPSPHVDQAVMSAIAAQSNRKIPAGATNGQNNRHAIPTPSYITSAREPRRSIVGATLVVALGGGVVARRGRAALAAGALKSRAVKTAASVALAVVLLLALFTTIYFSGSPTTQAFRLPPNLSWSSYVLYHSEMRIDAHGLRYYVDCYHDLGSDSMHVETIVPDQLDVIAVGNHHAMLGLDMMHHVAQWGANDWSVDETAFDLAELRSDLDAHRAVYLDQDVFQGHNVYRIRARNGLVLLLDMHYMPVNVLRGAVGPGTGEPIYDSL